MTDLQAQLQRTLGDGYVLERELGGGGMSRVFVATETALGRRVVVKVLPPDLAAGVSADRFRREIQLAASLQHPHIVPVLTAGLSDGLPYFTMPFEAGESLRARLTRDGKLPVRDVIAILRDVAQALSYAHAHGVMHRDVKPDNIMLTGGVAMVTDFGVAKAITAAGGSSGFTSSGLAVGTPAYMAPEQMAADRETDQRADLYALGAVGYEMLTGQALFPGRSAGQLLVAHVVETPRPVGTLRPDTPPALAALLTKCLEKDPANRPPSAGEVLRALDAVEGGGAAPSRRNMMLALGAAAVVVALGAWLVTRRGGARASSSDRSIAVLAFENAGGDKENEYFSDGIAEELMTQLSKVNGLRVAARTSAFAFKGKGEDARTIGKQLQVATVLEGSVRKSGNRMRITVRLVDASSGYQLWADEYQRDLTDVFAVQDEVAHAIVNALQIHLTPSGDATLVRRATTNVDAYTLYLRGRYFFERRTEADLKQAAEYFQQAIGADSMYAPAHSGLADSYSLTAVYGFAAPRSMFPKARQAADRAIQLDSLLPEAHNSLGLISLFYDFDYPAADREFSRAIALKPTLASAQLFHSWYCIAAGRTEEAVREIEAAGRIDPLSLIINTRIGSMLFYAKRYDSAAAQLQRTLALDSGYSLAHSQLARVYLVQGRCPEALAQVKRAGDFPVGHEGGLPGYAAAFCGDTAAARRALQNLLEASKRRFVSPETIAQIYAGLGDREQAIAWLRRALDDRVWSIEVLKVLPTYDGLRTDPRFQAILTAAKLN